MQGSSGGAGRGAGGQPGASTLSKCVEVPGVCVMSCSTWCDNYTEERAVHRSNHWLQSPVLHGLAAPSPSATSRIVP